MASCRAPQLHPDFAVTQQGGPSPRIPVELMGSAGSSSELKRSKTGPQMQQPTLPPQRGGLRNHSSPSRQGNSGSRLASRPRPGWATCSSRAFPETLQPQGWFRLQSARPRGVLHGTGLWSVGGGGESSLEPQVAQPGGWEGRRLPRTAALPGGAVLPGNGNRRRGRLRCTTLTHRELATAPDCCRRHRLPPPWGLLPLKPPARRGGGSHPPGLPPLLPCPTPCRCCCCPLGRASSSMSPTSSSRLLRPQSRSSRWDSLIVVLRGDTVQDARGGGWGGSHTLPSPASPHVPSSSPAAPLTPPQLPQPTCFGAVPTGFLSLLLLLRYFPTASASHLSRHCWRPHHPY
jgi:hypothetical protein